MQHRITQFLSAIIIAACALCTNAAAAPPKTEISFWHAMDGQRGEAVSELVKRFNQSQGEVEVKALYKGTYPEVLNAAIVASRQNTAPHLVQVFEVATLSMVLSDRIIPVYRLMQQQRMAVNWTDFLETINGYYAQNGRLYSMPFNVTTPILYYNKDAFKKAGLPDLPPVTWAEVEAASRKILATGAAKCGFTTAWPFPGADIRQLSWPLLENTFAWHDQPFATNQNGYTGLDTKLLINGAFGQMHVGALARWQQENVYAYGGRMGEVGPSFVAGDCAMLISTASLIGSFRGKTNFEWGTGQLPHWGPPYPKTNTIVGGASLWVLRGHEPGDDKGVAQFLKFLIEPPQQQWWAATTGFVPITKSTVKRLEGDAFYTQDPDQWTAVSQLLNATPTLNSQGLRLGNYVEVRTAIELELENIFAGMKTVKAGLDAAVIRGNAILRQFGVTHGAAASGEI